MSFDIYETSEYEISTISLATNYGVFDLSSFYVEINVFDHILLPCMSGNIILNESIGLSDKFIFDGSEFLYLDISKKDGQIRLKKKFHIYKQSNRKRETINSESYVLHFVSDEFVYSEQQTLNNHYSGTYSDMVADILQSRLMIPNDNFSIEPSRGIRDVIIPNLKPVEALVWCSKRALNNLDLPNFLFFENVAQYNFVSLSKLKSQESVMTILFETKNIENDISREFFGAKDFEIISQFDYLDNISSGVYSGTFIGFDPITKVIIEQELNFDGITRDNLLNRNPNQTKDLNRDGKRNTQMSSSRRVVYPTAIGRERNSYIRQNDPYSLNLNESPQYFVFQRRALLKQLFSQRLKVAMPGNFTLTSGVNVNLSKQKNSAYDSDNIFDQSLYGKYLVVASRHIIKQNMHETIIEVVTDSNNAT
jgi:hypothetical protein